MPESQGGDAAGTRESLREDHRIHDEDHDHNLKRLKGLYGAVARRQNDLIVRNCRGHRVLDVGAGYGNLSRALLDAGKEVVALEIDEEKIAKAREWFGVEVLPADFYSWEGPPVDSVIFREVLNHMDLGKALARAFEIARREVLIFQGTEILPLRLLKALLGHREYDQKRPEDLRAGLASTGFSTPREEYLDVLAYPLSGGWMGPCIVPPSPPLIKALLALEGIAHGAVKLFRAERYFCFRLLIAADRPGGGS